MTRRMIEFRLITGKTEGTWSLKGGTALRNGIRKAIGYFPLGHSIWVEDYKDSPIKLTSVVFKENNTSTDPAVNIFVSEDDKSLLDYLMAHEFYKVHYKIHDKEEIASEKSKEFDKIAQALDIVNAEKDDVRIQSMAIAVFGPSYTYKTLSECKAALKEKAVKSPSEIIEKTESVDYNSLFISALAFKTGIVKEDEGSQSVIWSDTEGVILRLATGQSGLDKLAQMLSGDKEENKILLQEISAKANNVVKQVSGDKEIVYQIPDETIKELSEKDKEIAFLKSELEKEKIRSIKVEGAEVIKTNTATASDLSNLDSLTLKEAQDLYVSTFKKELPPAQKGDLAWLIKKLKKGN